MTRWFQWSCESVYDERSTIRMSIERTHFILLCALWLFIGQEHCSLSLQTQQSSYKAVSVRRARCEVGQQQQAALPNVDVTHENEMHDTVAFPVSHSTQEGTGSRKMPVNTHCVTITISPICNRACSHKKTNSPCLCVDCQSKRNNVLFSDNFSVSVTYTEMTRHTSCTERADNTMSPSPPLPSGHKMRKILCSIIDFLCVCPSHSLESQEETFAQDKEEQHASTSPFATQYLMHSAWIAPGRRDNFFC